MEQSLVQRLSGLSSLHHNRHPFLGLQRPGAGPPSIQDKQDLIRVTESKDDNDEDDDPGDDDDEKRKKKKTRTVFSRSQVSHELSLSLSHLRHLQVFQLESTFDLKRYLSSSERAGLAASLHLTETQVGHLDHLSKYSTLTPSLPPSISGQDLVSKPSEQMEETAGG